MEDKNNRMATLENKPEDFYGQANSAYIRIAYNPAVRGYMFTVRNELFHHVQDASQLDEGMTALATIVRGMVEAALNHTNDVYQLGLEAEKQDFMDINTEEMPAEHAELLMGEAKGVA